jgi:uncharacterized protein (TIGR00725 family)
MKGRTIIAVVGGGKAPPSSVTSLAQTLGKAIASADGILLTGGTGGGAAVKDAAVDGAATGRVISILKDGNGVELRSQTRLIVNSGMKDARNVLNAFTPDVLIALPGGPGTLSEVAFAAVAGRPIVFLDSRQMLRDQIDGMTSIAEQAVAVFQDRRFAAHNLRRLVLSQLHDPSLDAACVEEALRRALSVPLVGMLPDIPGQPETLTRYKAALRALDA